MSGKIDGCPVSGRDKGIAKGVIQRNMPTACMGCGGPVGDNPFLLQLAWSVVGMSVQGICARCGVQVGASVAMDKALAGDSDGGLALSIGRLRGALGIDAALSREDAEKP